MVINIPIGGPESITITTYDTGNGLSGEVVSTIEREPVLDLECDSQEFIDGIQYNAAVNTVESLLLALACEGLLMEGDALNKAVQTAMQTLVESFT